MTEKQLLVERVFNEAKDVFLKYGVKSVTMSEIAKELGISKKTLYTVVKDKAELIEKVGFLVSDEILKSVHQLMSQGLDPITEIFEIENIVCSIISNSNPSAVYQLQKYYPDIYNKLHNKQQFAVINMIEDNLIRGIELGLFRKDINIKLISRMKYFTTMFLPNPEYFPEEDFDLMKTKHEYLIYHLHGIVSKKGLQIIDKVVLESNTINKHKN
ncbi:MAG: TetR/AcrR family transcriptional regulator [Ichthyobacteriaceae bacterium]|nr:TetR/AcrR family transcriptional regulator [Ichthyobacteriaceae bacterium]